MKKKQKGTYACTQTITYDFLRLAKSKNFFLGVANMQNSRKNVKIMCSALRFLTHFRGIERKVTNFRCKQTNYELTCSRLRNSFNNSRLTTLKVGSSKLDHCQSVERVNCGPWELPCAAINTLDRRVFSIVLQSNLFSWVFPWKLFFLPGKISIVHRNDRLVFSLHLAQLPSFSMHIHQQVNKKPFILWRRQITVLGQWIN